MFPVSEKAHMCRKSIIYIGFNAFPGFRHPLGPWDLSSVDKGNYSTSFLLALVSAILCLCLFQWGQIIAFMLNFALSYKNKTVQTVIYQYLLILNHIYI